MESQMTAPEAGEIKPEALSEQERAWITNSSRTDINGWVHLKIRGAPFQRGFQHGYLIAAEYAEALRVCKALTFQTLGMEYSFFTDEAAKYHRPIIERVAPDLLLDHGLSQGTVR